jgi:Tol biopolymer transport system component
VTACSGAVLGAAVLFACACSGATGPAEPAATAERPLPGRIVTTERGPRGGRLVYVDERGLTQADLTPIEPVTTLDTNASFSLDGRWVVFASTRGRRKLEETSLWIVPSHGGTPPVRLTQSTTADRDPRFVGQDGLVYASNAGTNFDLYYQPLESRGDGPPRAAGKPRRLTSTPGIDELSPSPHPNGRGVVYMAMERGSQKAALFSVAIAGGQPVRITDGPFDATPAFSPDGRKIAFSAPVKGRGDIDLCVANADGSDQRIIVEDAVGDEVGPAWSSDGHQLFATSVVRSAKTGAALVSLLVYIDMTEKAPRLRALVDPAGISPRLGVALVPGSLDAGALRQNPSLLDTTKSVIDRALEQQREQSP